MNQIPQQRQQRRQRCPSWSGRRRPGPVRRAVGWASWGARWASWGARWASWGAAAAAAAATVVFYS